MTLIFFWNRIKKEEPMKLTAIFLFIFIYSFGLLAKSKASKGNISLPKFPSNGGGSISLPIPGLSPLFYNNPAYGNFILHQYSENINALNARIPEPQSDLGIQYLNRQTQKDISEEIVNPSSSGNSMPIYRITNIIDHGRGENAKDPKFKNIDYLLWKFQGIDEGFTVQLNESKIELGVSNVFSDKPTSLINFVSLEKEKIFLLESRDNTTLTGFLVDVKTKNVNKIQCFKVKSDTREIYDYRILSEDIDFWVYLTLFKKK